MKINELVVDVNIIFNIIFSKRWNTLQLFDLFLERNVKLYAPEYLKIEVDKYFDFLLKKKYKAQYKLIQKLKIDLRQYLFNSLIFIDSLFYEDIIVEIYKEVAQVDPKDIDYVALAYKLNCPLWTNDKRLKELKSVKVVSTEDLMGE